MVRRSFFVFFERQANLLSGGLRLNKESRVFWVFVAKSGLSEVCA